MSREVWKQLGAWALIVIGGTILILSFYVREADTSTDTTNKERKHYAGHGI